MKYLRICLLIFASIISWPANAQYEEPDLSFINTLDEAKSFYEHCFLVLYTPDVTRDQISTANRNLYYLGRRLGMLDMTLDEEYNAFCKIQVRSKAEESDVTMLMFRIAYTFKGIQSILLGYLGQPLEKAVWMNFESSYHLFGSGSSILQIDDNIVCVEYKINNIKFIAFHNTDRHFAYDVKVYHKEKKYSKKKRKNIYETYERDITVLPEGAFIISSSMDATDMYFTPSSFKTTNKYYVH